MATSLAMPRNLIELRAEPGQFLTEETLRQRVPSAYATRPADGVSDKYRFFSTENVINELAQRDFFPVRAHTATSKRAEGETRYHVASPFGAHMLVFEPKQPMLIGHDRLQFVLMNSHDRSRRMRIAAGLFRIACANGLIAGSSELQAILPHRDLKELTLEAAVSTVMDHFTHLHEEVGSMKALELSPRRQVCLAQKAIAIRWGEDAKVNPKLLLNVRRDEDKGSDLWTTFNRIQENVVAGGIRAEGSPMETFPLTKPKQLFSFNSAFWNAALDMVN